MTKGIVDELREMKWKNVHNQEPQAICNLLLRAADTIESLTTKGQKCIVKGCTNHSNEGAFEGVVCAPCYNMLVTGKIGKGDTFLHEKERERVEAAHILLGLAAYYEGTVLKGEVK